MITNCTSVIIIILQYVFISLFIKSVFVKQVILMQIKFVFSNGLYIASKFLGYYNKLIVQPKMKIICSPIMSFQMFS